MTIEGLAGRDVGNAADPDHPDNPLHPVQQAFLEEGAFQCGYCTSGMILSAVALLDQKPDPSDADVRAWMNSNLCRCCGHTRILHAVRRAADAKAGPRGGEKGEKGEANHDAAR